MQCAQINFGLHYAILQFCLLFKVMTNKHCVHRYYCVTNAARKTRFLHDVWTDLERALETVSVPAFQRNFQTKNQRHFLHTYNLNDNKDGRVQL